MTTTYTCPNCGRAVSDHPWPIVGQYWDGEIVRAIDTCGICGDRTVTLNNVTVHLSHHCDTHAPERKAIK